MASLIQTMSLEARSDLAPNDGSYPSTNKVPLASEAEDESYLIAKDNRNTLERIQMPGIRKESLNTPQGVHLSP